MIGNIMAVECDGTLQCISSAQHIQALIVVQGYSKWFI